VEEKYVLNIVCSLWVKELDIDKTFIFIKEELEKNNVLELLSFDELYKYYHKYCSLNSIKMIVSKRYFEKYLNFTFSNYIVYDNFISSTLFTQK
jgi:hypothetical protein